MDAATDSDLIAACLRGDANTVQSLLAIGANANARSSDPVGRTALMVAAAHRHAEAATVLIEGGADVNLHDSAGATALIVAAAAKDNKIVRVLLGAGADPSAADRAGLRALDYAKQRTVDIRCPLLPGWHATLFIPWFGSTAWLIQKSLRTQE